MADQIAEVNQALLGRYMIERELGRGGMATVYLARDLRHDRQVALKVLHPELAHALGPERFLREIRLTARLQHPHILTVFDSGEAHSPGSEGPGQLWYTMPYVAGESLRALLNRDKHLAVDETLRIAQHVLAALDYAHGQGVVHRDIKPENILLEYPSRDRGATGVDRAVVADFGLARSISRAGGEKLTETGITVGTPAYMSPEQAAGEGDLEGRSDLYSVGCVLYEMLAGQPPFTGRSAQQILARHAVDPVPSLRTVRRTVPQQVEQAITRALAKVPADRFPTAAAFSLALSSSASVDLAEGRRGVRLRAVLGARPWLKRGALAAAGLVGVATAGVLLSRNGNPRALDPNLVAVAPFDVLDPKFELWREGLVDYLAKNLDGAGQLHTVAPVVVLQRWKGHADAGSARTLGRRSGARIVVFGNLSPAGRDSVRVRATVLDATSGASLTEFEGLDQLDRVDRLADSLTLQILRGLGRATTGGYVRLTSLGTRSIPAIKAYLKGEQYFRHARYDSADASYTHAIALDSTFALALLRLGDTRGWSGGDAPELHLRAARFNHGLSPRDSLIIIADSLRAAASSGQDSVYWSHERRMADVLEQAISLNRNDPEALLLSADVQFHQGFFAALEGGEKSVRQGFDAAIALDSTFAPAYLHPIELAGDAAHARPYVAGYLKAVAPDRHSAGAGLLSTLLDLSGKGLEHLLDSVSTAELGDVINSTSTWHDSAEIAVQVARVYYLRADNPEAGSGRPKPRLARQLAYRGHLREARATLGNRFGGLLVDLALLGAVPADTASALAAAWFRNPIALAVGEAVPPTTDPVRQFTETPRSAALWWASRGDSASLVALLNEQVANAKSDDGKGPPKDYAIGQATPEFTRAALALARADTAEALRRLSVLPDSVFGDEWRVRLLRFQLLAESGKHGEAAGVFDAQVLPPLSPLWVLGVLERGRMAERDGGPNRAAECYRFVRDVWLRADPELQRYVVEARAGYERLGGDAERN